MTTSNQKNNNRSQFKNLPPEFIYKLEQFNNKDYIADDIIPKIKEIEISL